MTNAARAAAISGVELYDMMATATLWLERNADAVNAINVFPVPDGDTGTNMALTMRATVDAAAGASTIGEVTRAMARGALMGARGNSGVIMSQFIRGLAAPLDICQEVGGAELAHALTAGAETAYGAVTTPVEGTILTVMRAGGRAAHDRAVHTRDIVEVMQAARDAAHEAVQRTPEQLPVLKEAGVVDSGGFGFAVLLDGALRFLRGEPLPEVAEDAGHIDARWLEAAGEAGDHDDGFGYCTEFMISGAELPVETLRSRVQEIGSSVLVVGDSSVVRVHVHTEDPGRALTIGATSGRISHVKVDDMEAQADQLAARTPPTGPLSVVAVGAGKGLIEMLRAVGAERVVTGGQTMNPSAEELLRAIGLTHGEQVIVLPNNKNIIWTAEQAATMATKPVHVVPTRSIPQGIAAILAVNPDASADENVEAMTAAARAVRTIEVTRASRAVVFNGVRAAPEQPIALIDDQLTHAAGTPEDAALDALAQVGGDGAVIAVYLGKDTAEERGEQLAGAIRERYPDAEVEVCPGGQPFYDYVISVE
jgi:uncharacterized protein